MSAATKSAPRTEKAVTDGRRRVFHLGCSERLEDRALCGWRRPAGDGGPVAGSPICEVCLSLAHRNPICPTCGEPHYTLSGWGVPIQDQVSS